jgi:hypothetical protein
MPVITKYQIIHGSQRIEFASQEAAETYKSENSLDSEITSFTEIVLEDSRETPIITPRQIRLALIGSGLTLTQIDQLIDSLEEPNKTYAKIAWEYSIEFERSHPLVEQFGEALGLSSEQIDALFVAAADL